MPVELSPLESVARHGPVEVRVKEVPESLLAGVHVVPGAESGAEWERLALLEHLLEMGHAETVTGRNCCCSVFHR